MALKEALADYPHLYRWYCHWKIPVPRKPTLPVRFLPVGQ
jgi:hypothetical protein